MSGAEADYSSEPEEDPEEEVEEDPEEEEIEEDPEEEEIEEDPEEDEIEEIDEPKVESDIPKGPESHEGAFEKGEHTEISRKPRKTRWENPPPNESSAKRKSRWDDQDSQNALLSSLLDLTDPKTMHLRTRLIEMQNKLTEKFVKKVYIPQDEHPSYNFVGLILGPQGSTIKKMEKKTQARIYIRGVGSGDPGSNDQKLHVLVEAPGQKSLDSAVSMIEKLLVPLGDEENSHKKDQLAQLAKIRGTYQDYSTCRICHEKGHKQLACPFQDSTFKAMCCDLCGSFAHSTSKCDVPGLPFFCKEKSSKDVDPTNLYVSGLPVSMDDKQLKELFLPFGRIVSTRVMRYQPTGVSKGCGFVKFESAVDAADATKYLNGHRLGGQILAVRVAGLRPGLHSNGSVESVDSVLPRAPECVPFFLGYPADVAPTEGLNVPPYFVSSNTSTVEAVVTGDGSSSYDFCDRIPSTVPTTLGRFAGHSGLEFGPWFSSPVTNEAQYQMDRKSNFWGGSGFP